MTEDAVGMPVWQWIQAGTCSLSELRPVPQLCVCARLGASLSGVNRWSKGQILPMLCPARSAVLLHLAELDLCI